MFAESGIVVCTIYRRVHTFRVGHITVRWRLKGKMFSRTTMSEDFLEFKDHEEAMGDSVGGCPGG